MQSNADRCFPAVCGLSPTDPNCCGPPKIRWSALHSSLSEDSVMPTLGTTLGTILQNQKGTLTGRLRVRAVRLAARKWYDAGGRWNPPSGAGSDTYWDGIEERMTLFGKYEKQEGFFS